MLWTMVRNHTDVWACLHVKLNSVHYTMCTINMVLIRFSGFN